MKIEQNLRVDDFSIGGLDKKLSVNPVLVSKWIQKINTPGIVSIQDAKHFLSSSRYYNNLSPELQRTEAINAIPFPTFIRWLNECDKTVIIINHEVQKA